MLWGVDKNEIKKNCFLLENFCNWKACYTLQHQVLRTNEINKSEKIHLQSKVSQTTLSDYLS